MRCGAISTGGFGVAMIGTSRYPARWSRATASRRPLNRRPRRRQLRREPGRPRGWNEKRDWLTPIILKVGPRRLPACRWAVSRCPCWAAQVRRQPSDLPSAPERAHRARAAARSGGRKAARSAPAAPPAGQVRRSKGWSFRKKHRPLAIAKRCGVADLPRGKPVLSAATLPPAESLRPALLQLADQPRAPVPRADDDSRRLTPDSALAS